MATLTLAPDLYSNPPKTAIPGARVDYRAMYCSTTQLATGNIIALAVLPAGHQLTRLEVESDIVGSVTHSIIVGFLNTYYNQALPSAAVPAAYNSGGFVDVQTTSAVVTGQTLILNNTVTVTGGRISAGLGTIQPTKLAGIDYKNDRILAVSIVTGGSGTAAGTIGLIATFDQP